MFWPRRRVPDQCLQSSVSVGALSFWAVFFSLNASGLVLVHARLHLFAPFEMVDGDFGSFASGGRWAAASPRTPVFLESFSVIWLSSCLMLICLHLQLLKRFGEISAVSLRAFRFSIFWHGHASTICFWIGFSAVSRRTGLGAAAGPHGPCNQLLLTGAVGLTQS